MQTAGIIIEYNPMHRGHLYLLEQTRAKLGPDTAIIGVMSGDFVQRGDFAILRKHARAEAAVRSGMDLVLELPLPWAVASAERFADGGVQVLTKTGLVTHLVFGSECGDMAAIRRVAEALTHPELDTLIQWELKKGDNFAAARQRAVAELVSPEDAALLDMAESNNILGIEYCKALLRQGSAIQPMTVKRKGMRHNGPSVQDFAQSGPASATRIRVSLERGKKPECKDWALREMVPAMADIYQAEEAAGRAPVFPETYDRAVLARLRSMTEADFAALDEGREGLYHRLYEASRTACSVDEVCFLAKSKRYAYARLRRMVLWAYLGMKPADFPAEIPYLRVLAANEKGRALLARMRETVAVPVLTKPNHVRRLDETAQALFSLEARAADLYALAYPDLTAAAGGSAWREGPVIL